MIVVVDYGMGNLHSVSKALARAGGQVKVSNDPGVVAEAKSLVLPGVGAFGDAMRQLRSMGLVSIIRDHIEADKPFLGICLGLQLLFEKGYEDGEHEGLGVLSGEVTRFDLTDPSLKIPHMGWNQVRISGSAATLDGITAGDYFYFVHSYYVQPKDNDAAATWTNYGGEFVSSVARGRLFASQFHPEKSQKLGLKLLRNFVKLSGKGLR